MAAVIHDVSVSLLLLCTAGCGAAHDGGPPPTTVVTVPKAQASPKPRVRDVPAPSSNSGAWVASEEDTDEEPLEDEPFDVAPATPWGSGIGPTGGPDCDRAADCCLKIVTLSSSGMTQTCDMFRTAPAGACQQLLTSFRSAAPQIGVQCP